MPHLEDLARLIDPPVGTVVPPDERWDATAEVWGQVKRGGVDTVAVANIQQGVDWLMQDKRLLAKALQMEGYALPMEDRHRRRDKIGRGHDSVLYVNEYGLVDRHAGHRSRWIEKPTVGGFPFLKDIFHNADLLKTIILTALQEMVPFWHLQRGRDTQGFRLRRRDGQRLTDADKPRIARIERWLLDCGDEHDPVKRKRLRRDSFSAFMRKTMLDSLRYDANPIEIECSVGGKPSGVYAVPGDTVRLCTEDGYEGHDEIQAIQVIDNVPYTSYTYADLVYEVRNPRTDLIVNGYGMAEGELFVRILTAWLNSFEYYRAGLDRNAMPRQILALFGPWEQRELNSLAHQLQARLVGPANRHTLPIIGVKQPDGGGKGIEAIKIDDHFDEMFLAKWMTLHASIGTALFGMHPVQINMPSFDSSNASPLSGSDTAEKLASARDKGLLTRLAYAGNLINTWIIPRLDDAYELEWGGLNEEDEQRHWEREKLGSTHAEIRASQGKEPTGNAILDEAPTGNLTAMQVYMASLQQPATPEKPVPDEQPDETERGAAQPELRKARAGVVIQPWLPADPPGWTP